MRFLLVVFDEVAIVSLSLNLSNFFNLSRSPRNSFLTNHSLLLLATTSGARSTESRTATQEASRTRAALTAETESSCNCFLFHSKSYCLKSS